MSERYDVIVIGSGPGGGTTAAKLAETGKRVLLLERGDYLPRERGNWDSKVVFADGKYVADETFYDIDDNTFHPELHYFVGGNSKVYGAALFRLAPHDFEDVQHPSGVAPDWPISYADLEPLAYPFNRSSAGRRLARVVRPAGAPGSAGSHECSVAPRGPNRCGTMPGVLPWTPDSALRHEDQPAQRLLRLNG